MFGGSRSAEPAFCDVQRVFLDSIRHMRRSEVHGSVRDRAQTLARAVRKLSRAGAGELALLHPVGLLVEFLLSSR